MNLHMYKISLVIVCCAAIAISNQVWADEQANEKEALSRTMQIDPDPDGLKRLQLEEDKLKAAKEKAIKEGNILRPEEVVIGPKQNETWPEK